MLSGLLTSQLLRCKVCAGTAGQPAWFGRDGNHPEDTLMKLEWHKPEVTEQEVGLEVTSYAPAELDRS
jgi:coenzyme PQQ precursor peptide PqqA